MRWPGHHGLRASVLCGLALLPQVAVAQPPTTDLASSGHFSEQAAETGLDFSHFNGMSGELYFVEMNGPGGALFDFDNDGDLDVYLGQGGMLGPGKELADALFQPSGPAGDRLFRNDLVVAADGSRRLSFTDVTEAAGFAAGSYAQGVATGDFDNDGWVDLYLTNFGDNQLWRNLGTDVKGRVRFADVTSSAGVGDRRWSVAALFFDYDRDGWLDLYVGNYVDFTFANHKRCRAASGREVHCGPRSYRPESDRLFRNLGDGRFEDMTIRAGLGGSLGHTLGAVSADFDGDGRPDLYVANDSTPNRLWLNRDHDGVVRFVDEGLLAGCALNADGVAEAGMGVAAGDFDNDGDEDILLSHLTDETNTIYRNDGGAMFEDASIESGIAAPSWPYTGFGAGWLDFDNDGWLDLAVFNGAVVAIETQAAAGDPYPLHQTNQLFRSMGGERFEEVTDRAGAAFSHSEVSRGAAFGDVDNDGDTDILVINNSGPVRLLINETGHLAPWLGLRLVGPRGRRDMLGAWVGVERMGAPTLWRRVRAGGSFASASDPRVIFGLGGGEEVERIRVRWPDGQEESWPALPPGRYHQLRQGTGRASG